MNRIGIKESSTMRCIDDICGARLKPLRPESEINGVYWCVECGTSYVVKDYGDTVITRDEKVTV